jgi:predicted nucleic acid-binding protein
MTGERFTIDSNILIYAFDRSAGERQAVATRVIKEAVGQSCVLTLQAISEFFHVAVRKGRLGMSEAEAQVRDWYAMFPVAAATPSTLIRAIGTVREHGLAFWDAMLWACAREAGCTLVLSEDFQHGRMLEGVRFHNPFCDAPT